jgi:hypothetical protein
MQQNRAEKFRQEAAECRRRAEQTAASEDKKAWLMLAEDWCKLAQAEDQAGNAANLSAGWPSPRT